MPMPPAPQKRSRAGALTAGAVAVAIVSAGVGGGVALLVQPDRPSASSSATGLAPSVPAASLPAGSIEQVAAKVVPSVVKLEVDLGKQSEEGSGVILSSDGLILTNAHVIQGAQSITIGLADGRHFSGNLVGADTGFDVAVLKIEGSNLPAATLGDSANLQVGDPVEASWRGR